MVQGSNRYAATFPGEFFRSRELDKIHSATFQSSDDLWKVLLEEQELPISDMFTSNKLRSYTSVDSLYFRGQSNADHGLSASLHRFVKDECREDLSEELLGAVEQRILDEAADYGLNKNVSPGELLMILQHHFAPTRLLDVSLKPLEALFFAVEKADLKDGRLFIVWLNGQQRVSLGGRLDLPWAEHVRDGGKAASEWTQSVRLVDEQPLDPRMIAQQGRFLVGGIQRAYSDLNIWYDKQLRVAERQAISMFSISFPKVPQAQMTSTSWPALGWTIRIPANWKLDLRIQLEAAGISHDTMYPDLANIPWRAERAGREFLGSRR